MKTLKAIFTFIAIVSFMQVSLANTATTNAAPNDAMFVQTVSHAKNSVALRLVRQTTDKLLIHLKDTNGTVHYFEKVNHQRDYYRNFQMSNIGDGAYYFTIKNANETLVVKHFTIEDGVVTLINPNEVINATDTETAYSLLASSTNNQSLAVYFQNNTEEKATIRLKNKAGKTVYFQKVKADTKFSKQLILSELPDGTYFLSIDNTNETQELKIKEGKVALSSQTPRA